MDSKGALVGNLNRINSTFTDEIKSNLRKLEQQRIPNDKGGGANIEKAFEEQLALNNAITLAIRKVVSGTGYTQGECKEILGLYWNIVLGAQSKNCNNFFDGNEQDKKKLRELTEHLNTFLDTSNSGRSVLLSSNSGRNQVNVSNNSESEPLVAIECSVQ